LPILKQTSTPPPAEEISRQPITYPIGTRYSYQDAIPQMGFPVISMDIVTEHNISEFQLEHLATIPLPGHIRYLYFSYDDASILHPMGNTVREWDIFNQTYKTDIFFTESGAIFDLDISSNERLILIDSSQSGHGVSLIQFTNDTKLLFEHETPVFSIVDVAISENNLFLLAVTSDAEFFVWSTVTKELFAHFQLNFDFNPYEYEILFSHDNSKIIAANSSGRLLVVDMDGTIIQDKTLVYSRSIPLQLGETGREGANYVIKNNDNKSILFYAHQEYLGRMEFTYEPFQGENDFERVVYFYDAEDVLLVRTLDNASGDYSLSSANETVHIKLYRRSITLTDADGNLLSILEILPYDFSGYQIGIRYHENGNFNEVITLETLRLVNMLNESELLLWGKDHFYCWDLLKSEVTCEISFLKPGQAIWWGETRSSVAVFHEDKSLSIFDFESQRFFALTSQFNIYDLLAFSISPSHRYFAMVSILEEQGKASIDLFGVTYINHPEYKAYSRYQPH
jgi:WD40 repeat protein